MRSDVLPVTKTDVITNQTLIKSSNPLVQQAGKDLQSGKPLTAQDKWVIQNLINNSKTLTAAQKRRSRTV